MCLSPRHALADEFRVSSDLDIWVVPEFAQRELKFAFYGCVIKKLYVV